MELRCQARISYVLEHRHVILPWVVAAATIGEMKGARREQPAKNCVEIYPSLSSLTINTTYSDKD